MSRHILGLLLVAGFLAPLPARADEGMWLFNNPPKQYLKDTYKFDATDKWLEHVQKSSVRFNTGGSGSFVSADGLVMTNHHVAADTLQKLSDKEGFDYVKNGFHARNRDQEKKAIGLELNVLMSMEDVTDTVKSAVKPDMKPAEAAAARRAAIGKIEKESLDKTGLRSDVVTLYHGGQYQLYRYKKYTDVRLVFAPEKQIAFFGGDPDNFEYPRYDLDVTFFRVYENDKPVKLEHHLAWSRYGTKDGDLIFVSGHPGRTSRMNTVAELNYLRNTGFPFLLQRLYRWEVLLKTYSDRSAENARKAEDFLFGVANSRKARRGGLQGLLDPELMAKKIAAEKKLRAGVKENEKLKDAAGAWNKIAEAQKIRAKIIRPYTMLEAGAGFNCELFQFARALLRAADELAKPNSERLSEYQEAKLPTLKFQLLGEEKLFPDYEMTKLADGLTYLAEELGTDNPLVRKVLAGKSPQDRAAELIKGTKLADQAYRKQLFEGGKNALADVKDTMIDLAKLVDEPARKVRKQMEEQVLEAQTQAYAQIANAKYVVEGASTYPDATFTLRLAFGTVKGFEQDGKKIPAHTRMGGLYERAAAFNYKPPFDLPQRWVEKKDKLDLKTPFNFVSTADIIGGNSGSPVINRDAEVVGIIFDGNIQSLVLDFAYTDEQARAVSVDSRAIIEALRKVYNATELLEELTGKKATSEEK